MKIVVLSDSHGAVKMLDDIITFEKPDCFVFCGDGIGDVWKVCDKYPSLYCHIVSGNCDRIDNFPLFKDFDMCGKRFFITHGHYECVKSGYMNLASKALSCDADIALYGHTHIQKCDMFGDLMILNPGSAHEGNYAVVDISEDTGVVKYDFKNIKGYV